MHALCSIVSGINDWKHVYDSALHFSMQILRAYLGTKVTTGSNEIEFIIVWPDSFVASVDTVS